MTPETQALMETLEMFIEDQKARRCFDTPEQDVQDGEYNWSDQMKTAMEQLEQLQNGTLIVVKRA